MAVDKLNLSGSTNGRGISVAASSSPGTLIHTGPTDTNSYDEIWLYAHNPQASAKITIQWGGTTAPDDLYEYTPTAETGLHVIASGLILRGNATALIIRAFQNLDVGIGRASIFGYVNRIY